MNARRYDSFGVGFYYNEFSSDRKINIRDLTAGTAKLSDESGVEVFYDLAITPAVRLIPSYQHIWNPFSRRSSPPRTMLISFSPVSPWRGDCTLM